MSAGWRRQRDRDLLTPTTTRYILQDMITHDAQPNPGEPKYTTWDQYNLEKVLDATKATNEKFGAHQGNATLDGYDGEQAVYFAQQVFGDPTITRVEITPVKNVAHGWNEFFIQAWTE